jgi:hypothetical protein
MHAGAVAKRKVGGPRIVDVTPELISLLDELDIRMVSTRAYRGPGVTMATGCLRRILQQHGSALGRCATMRPSR